MPRRCSVLTLLSNFWVHGLTFVTRRKCIGAVCLFSAADTYSSSFLRIWNKYMSRILQSFTELVTAVALTCCHWKESLWSFAAEAARFQDWMINTQLIFNPVTYPVVNQTSWKNCAERRRTVVRIGARPHPSPLLLPVPNDCRLHWHYTAFHWQIAPLGRLATCT